MEASLLYEMIESHGGLSVWNQFNRIIATVSFGGLAFNMKFNFPGKGEYRYIISLDYPMIVIENFPEPGQQGVFTPELVWVESLEGQKIKERTDPRGVIQRWPHSVCWDELDLLYFAGYACWNYFNTPFLFAQPDFEIRQLSDWKENGRIFKRVEVIFPDHLHTHCKKQIYYFDKSGMLHRFDYDPEVFTRWARAAQYCFDYKSCSGIWLPMKRSVFPRKKDGNIISGLTLVWINVKEVHFQ